MAELCSEIRIALNYLIFRTCCLQTLHVRRHYWFKLHVLGQSRKRLIYNALSRGCTLLYLAQGLGNRDHDQVQFPIFTSRLIYTLNATANRSLRAVYHFATFFIPFKGGFCSASAVRARVSSSAGEDDKSVSSSRPRAVRLAIMIVEVDIL